VNKLTGIDDRNRAILTKVPVCAHCQHYKEEGKCVAFPEGIPKEIFLFGNKHIEPFPGDHGIRFEGG